MGKPGDRVKHRTYGLATVVNHRSPFSTSSWKIIEEQLKRMDNGECVLLLFDNKTSGSFPPYYYASSDLCELINSAAAAAVADPEPKNNDGRDKCFWCGMPTKKVPTMISNYDICSKCGR